MKKFIALNWYRFVTATSMFILATAFFVFALKNNVLKAEPVNTQMPQTSSSIWIVVKGNTVYEVTWDKFTDAYKCKPVCNSIH